MERTPVANVSLLTDLLIANLPADGLRSVLRTLVSSHPDIVKDLTSRSQSYLQRQYMGPERTIGGDLRPTGDIGYMQKIIRSFIGCRLPLESLLLLAHTLRICKSMFEVSFGDQERLLVVSMDGDIAQALSLLPTKCPGAEAISAIEDLFSSIESLKAYYRFERSRATLVLLHPDLSFHAVVNPSKITGIRSVDDAGGIETFRIGNRSVPRVFCGLWQLCSSAWGVSPLPEIMDGFETYLRKGFTAFDMADLYGDVEVIFGEFRSRLAEAENVFAATKYCVFNRIENISDQIETFVSQRLHRLKADSVDLLQLHWQDYTDLRYMHALKALQDDPRVVNLGLCNFDTENMEVALRGNIDIKTNQVQFSLIDSRPTVKMAAVCEEHNIKLLTYGTLCGGFISESWCNRPEPAMFSEEITPSQRKYFEMIISWGGWSLFQELLATLSTVAEKHHVSVSNVATRWVLDFPFVGAVIIGSRIGISERADDNLAVYGWHLDEDDQAAIERVLALSRREEMFHEIGDCGSEHR